MVPERETAGWKIILTSAPQLRWIPEERTKVPHAKINAAWNEARRENPGLYDGTLAEFVKLDANNVTVRFVPYRYYVASRRCPGLGLDIIPVGVSGVVLAQRAAKRYVLLGKRGRHVSQHPGCFELVPSGTIDQSAGRSDGSVDFTATLRQEFIEETGAEISCIAQIEPFCLVYDEVEPTYDVCCLILFKGRRESLLTSCQRGDEYTDAFWLSVTKWDSFVTGNPVVPTSQALLEALDRYNP